MRLWGGPGSAGAVSAPGGGLTNLCLVERGGTGPASPQHGHQDAATRPPLPGAVPKHQEPIPTPVWCGEMARGMRGINPGSPVAFWADRAVGFVPSAIGLGQPHARSSRLLEPAGCTLLCTPSICFLQKMPRAHHGSPACPKTSTWGGLFLSPTPHHAHGAARPGKACQGCGAGATRQTRLHLTKRSIIKITLLGAERKKTFHASLPVSTAQITLHSSSP